PADNVQCQRQHSLDVRGCFCRPIFFRLKIKNAVGDRRECLTWLTALLPRERRKISCHYSGEPGVDWNSFVVFSGKLRGEYSRTFDLGSQDRIASVFERRGRL